MLNPKKLLIVTTVAAATGIPAAYAQDGAVMEEVVVRGIKSSLERSLDIKRDSTRIVEAITADDIGKMPDQNIAESLQRLPGVQIDRRDGIGTKVRIRGLDQNVTLLNGERFTSGMEYFQLGESRQEFDSSLESIPSELLGGVEIYKTPDASMIEGGMGGIVNLMTREALDLNDLLLAANLKGDYGTESQDAKPNAFFVIGNNWNDTFGAIFSVSASEQVVQSDSMQSFSRGAHRYGGEAVTSDGTEYHAPSMFYATDSNSLRERLGASLNLQYRLSDATEFTFDYFHSEQDITTEQYTIKYAWSDNNFSGIDESYSNVIDTSREYNILQDTYQTYDYAENNSAGEVTEVSTDNFSLGFKFDDGGSIRVNASVAGSTSELEQRAGYGDSRFSGYGQTTYVGTAGADGTPTGWAHVNNNQPVADNNRTFHYVAGDRPTLAFVDPEILADADYFTYKSHWALGSDVENDRFSARADLEWDIDVADLKTLSFGVRGATDEVEFNELRYMTDFSRTTGANVMDPTMFNSDGSVASATTFDPNVSFGLGEPGIREPVFYDLCGNGGIPGGRTCDINGDGYDDNHPFGPWGYFMDAGIGSKTFDLYERLYLTDSDGNPVDTTGFQAGSAQIITGTDPNRGDYIERPLSVTLYGIDTDINWERWRNSPGLIAFETFNQNPGRYVLLTDFFPSGGQPSRVLFQDASQITGNVEGWIDGITPNSPGQWMPAPLESWKVKESTTALYAMADFEGQNVPYTLNVGVRAVNTEVDVTKAVVDEQANSEQWTLASDGWNSQGVLLPGSWAWRTTTKDYWDLLPSLNFVLDTSDDTKLRFSASKVLARPNLQQLGKGFQKQFTREDDPTFGTYYRFLGGSDGNPDLNPYRATQADIAYEWYFGDLSYFSFGAFVKAVDTFIGNQTIPEFGADDGPGGGRIGDVNRPFNGSGGSVKGLELALQQSWENGFGVAFNYTLSESTADITTATHQNAGLPGVSERAYNLMGFFENNSISARLAYTWRDEYLSPFRSAFAVNGIENGMSEIFDEYGQWDGNITWDINENWSLTAEALNITGEEQTSYLGYPNNPMTYTSQEPRFILGASFRL